MIPVQVPQKLAAGEVQKILYIKGIQNHSIEIPKTANGTSLISGDLYGSTYQKITTQFKVIKNDFLHPDVHQWMEHSYFVEIPKLIQRPQLRIPASVWNGLVNNEEQSKKDSDLLKEIYQKNMAKGELSNVCWTQPIDSKVVSQFASPRTLPNGNSYFHTGLDLRAATGTPIHSPADGTVIYSGEMVTPGQLVILNHGSGLYSRYLHLSKRHTREGEVVKRGQLLGLAGGTGRVEAPHLHWEVMWQSKKLHPQAFVHAWNRDCVN